jgi:hypothetical protein
MNNNRHPCKIFGALMNEIIVIHSYFWVEPNFKYLKKHLITIIENKKWDTSTPSLIKVGSVPFSQLIL